VPPSSLPFNYIRPQVRRLTVPRNSHFSRGLRGPPPTLIPVSPRSVLSPLLLLSHSFGDPDWLRQPVDSTSCGRVARRPIPLEATRQSLRPACCPRCTALTQLPVGATRPPLAMVSVSALGRFSERWLRFSSSVLGRKTRTPIAEMPHVRRTTWQACSRCRCHSSTTRRFQRLANWICEVAVGL
jgi:hypothetical protein